MLRRQEIWGLLVMESLLGEYHSYYLNACRLLVPFFCRKVLNGGSSYAIRKQLGRENCPYPKPSFSEIGIGRYGDPQSSKVTMIPILWRSKGNRTETSCKYSCGELGIRMLTTQIQAVGENPSVQERAEPREASELKPAMFAEVAVKFIGIRRYR